MIKNILLAFFSVLISLTMIEVFLQIVDERQVVLEQDKENWAIVPERVWTEYDPMLGWFHQKNKTATLRKNELEVTVTTNSMGFRSLRNYENNKPAGKIRGMLLGDSFFFGWGVPDEDTISAVMESREKNLEVINFGIPGYGLDQMLVGFREMGKKLQPDVVFVGIYPEDFWRSTRAFADTGHAKPYFVVSKDQQLMLKNIPVPPKYALKRDQFPALFDQTIWERLLSKSLLYRYVKRAFLKIGKNLNWVDPDTTIEWRIGKLILKDLVQEVADSGAKPVLVIVPPERWVKEERVTSLRQSILRFAGASKVDIIDLTADFQDVSKSVPTEMFYIPDDGHWSSRGNRFVAERLMKYLKDHQFV